MNNFEILFAQNKADKNINKYVDEYCEEHFVQETGYVLDDTLTLENAAAQAKAVGDALAGKADTSSLATVATSGSYNDLTDKPDIPSDADDIAYDNTESGLAATNVQDAIDEVNGNIVDVEANPSGSATADLEKLTVGSTIYNILGEKVYGEASGAIASFSDGADDKPLQKLEVGIEPVQDLHGYSNPWPAGGGVNQWDEEWELGVYDASGVKTSANNRICSKNKIKVTPDASYYTTQRIQICTYDVNGTFIERRSFTPENTTFNVGANTYYIAFHCDTAYGTTYNNNISINYPSSATSYAPYSNACPISGFTETNVNRAGKNLANLVYGDKVPSVATGQMVSTNGWSTDYIRLDKTKNYIASSASISGVSTYILFYDNSKSYLGYVLNFTNTGYAINSSQYWQNADYIKFRADANSSTQVLIQLELGSTATAYEAFVDNTYTVSFGNAGTVYGGTLDVVSGGLTVKWKITDLGSLNWVAGFNGYYTQSLQSEILIPSIWSDSKALCTEFKLGNVARSDSFYVQPTGTYGGILVCLPTDTTITAEQFKESVNGVKLVYEVIESAYTTYQLTPTQVSSILGTNNIWADSGDSDVVYIRDLNICINDLINRIEALEQ